MTEVDNIEHAPPRCPMCSGATRLKEVFRRSDGWHCVFKCVICAVEYPVVELTEQSDQATKPAEESP